MWDLSEFKTEENPIDTLGALGADLTLYFYIWCQWLSDSMWNVFFLMQYGLELWSLFLHMVKRLVLQHIKKWKIFMLWKLPKCSII